MRSRSATGSSTDAPVRRPSRCTACSRCSRCACSPSRVVGIFATGNDDVAEDIVSWLGLHGDAAKTVIDAVNTAQHSAKVASVVGLVGLVWVGSSFAVAVASAYDVAWGVPSRAYAARLVGLGWLAGERRAPRRSESIVTAGLDRAPGAGRAARARGQPGGEHRSCGSGRRGSCRTARRPRGGSCCPARSSARSVSRR